MDLEVAKFTRYMREAGTCPELYRVVSQRCSWDVHADGKVTWSLSEPKIRRAQNHQGPVGRVYEDLAGARRGYNLELDEINCLLDNWSRNAQFQGANAVPEAVKKAWRDSVRIVRLYVLEGETVHP